MTERKLSKWLSSRRINLNLHAESELETILAMLEMVKQSAVADNIEQLADELFRHEVLSPSPAGCCSVVFRVLTDSVSEAGMYFGRFQGGIGYYARSGHPIDLIVLIVAPNKQAEEFHYIVRKMENILCENAVTELLRQAKSVEDALKVFSETAFVA